MSSSSRRQPRAGLARALMLSAFVSFPSLLWWGCGSDEDGSSCTPGELQPCQCSGTESGEQACASDGASFGACDCSPTGSGGSAGGGNGGSAGGNMAGAAGTTDMGPAEFTGATGLPCETDGDCFGGMICSPATAAENPYGTGGVQGGVCTAPCTDSADCLAVDSNSECIALGQAGEGFCRAVCLVGAAGPDRCSGRFDMACVPSNAVDPSGQIGLCRPLCTSDADCGGGRFCDLGTRLCVDALPTRGPGIIGAACNVATEATDCLSGACLQVEADGSGLCTSICVLGPLAGCGFSEEATPRDAACLLPVNDPVVIGDVGLCLELCDADTDCEQPNFECSALSAGGQEFFGRTGQCAPPAAGGADAGADGG